MNYLSKSATAGVLQFLILSKYNKKSKKKQPKTDNIWFPVA